MLDLTKRENSMTHRARVILRGNAGKEMKQIDVWHMLPSDYQRALLHKYGTEKAAKTSFFNAIATMNTTDPNVVLVTMGANGTSTYRWNRNPSKTNGRRHDRQSHDEDMSFAYVGQTNDGTPLYRNASGVIGMLEWSPL